MDRTILINVNGSYIRKDNSVAGVQGEGNSTVMNIVFDESWADFTKKVTFWNSKGLNPVEVTLGANLLTDITTSHLNYSVPIPSEPLEFSGEMMFVIDGYVDGVRRRSLSDTLDVKYAPIAENAGNAVEPTPTTIEQMQGQIDSLLGDIQAERILSQNAANNAKSSEEKAVASEQNSKNSETNASISETNAKSSEEKAKKSEDSAGNSAIEAKSWAVGGTGTRAGEDINNAKFWAEQARAIVSGDYVTTSEFEETMRGVGDAIAKNSDAISYLRGQAKNYVQKEAGKGLSTNDYTNEAVEEVSKIAGKENKATFSLYTILASGWSAEGTYSFETLYPAASYNIEIQPAESCTVEQFTAWSNAGIIGNSSSNVIKALGDIPSVDIPIIVKAVMK